jgi:GAF domain-containing protein
MSRSDTLDRICQALSELISGPDLGVGVKLREGDFLRLLCHYGFGAKGPKIERLPFAQSFGRLVLERNHSGYLEDIALRPDLIIPQPAEGEPFRSILSAPLRVNGRAIGTLEVYSRQRRTWTDEQIGIVESIAAQTSVSLQAAELFDRVDQERRRFQTIFRTLPIGVCVYDAASGKIVNNPEAVLLLGQPAETTLDERRTAKYRVVRHGVEVPFEQFPLLRSLSGEEVHGEELDLIFPARRR